MYLSHTTNSYIERYFFRDIDVPRYESKWIDLYRFIINFIFDFISRLGNSFSPHCVHEYQFNTFCICSNWHCPWITQSRLRLNCTSSDKYQNSWFWISYGSPLLAHHRTIGISNIILRVNSSSSSTCILWKWRERRVVHRGRMKHLWQKEIWEWKLLLPVWKIVLTPC